VDHGSIPSPVRHSRGFGVLWREKLQSRERGVIVGHRLKADVNHPICKFGVHAFKGVVFLDGEDSRSPES
jgi:hypothetical protein